jgi:hypothetical protein
LEDFTEEDLKIEADQREIVESELFISPERKQ